MTPNPFQVWAMGNDKGGAKEQSSGSITRRSRLCEHIFESTGRASTGSIRTRSLTVPRAPPLEFLFTLSEIMFPQTTAQFCPFFKNPTDIVDNDDSVREDIWIPMQKAWRKVHVECVSTVCGTCKGREKARDDTEKQPRMTYVSSTLCNMVGYFCERGI